MSERLVCPNCGADDWRADYYQAVHQGVVVVKDEDGELCFEDWAGDERSYDDGDTQVDRVVCDSCSWTIYFGRFNFQEYPKPIQGRG
jgi:hypothetical protein